MYTLENYVEENTISNKKIGQKKQQNLISLENETFKKRFRRKCSNIARKGEPIS